MVMMKPARIDLVIYQGATYWEEWIWKDADEEPVEPAHQKARRCGMLEHEAHHVIARERPAAQARQRTMGKG